MCACSGESGRTVKCALHFGFGTDSHLQWPTMPLCARPMAVWDRCHPRGKGRSPQTLSFRVEMINSHYLVSLCRSRTPGSHVRSLEGVGVLRAYRVFVCVLYSSYLWSCWNLFSRGRGMIQQESIILLRLIQKFSLVFNIFRNKKTSSLKNLDVGRYSWKCLQLDTSLLDGKRPDWELVWVEFSTKKP